MRSTTLRSKMMSPNRSAQQIGLVPAIERLKYESYLPSGTILVLSTRGAELTERILIFFADTLRHVQNAQY